MKTILVTGGTGYIGTHTNISLLENGYKLIVVDSNINSSKKSLTRVSQITKKKNRKYFLGRVILEVKNFYIKFF